MSAANQEQINKDAAEAMYATENPQSDEYSVEEPRQKSAEEQARDEAAAEAMRRADVAYTKDGDEM